MFTCLPLTLLVKFVGNLLAFSDENLILYQKQRMNFAEVSNCCLIMIALSRHEIHSLRQLHQKESYIGIEELKTR